MQSVSRSDTVTSVFGYWPDFADAKVVLFAFESLGTIRLELSYIDAELQKAMFIGLRFTGVRDLDLGELRSENVVDRLTFAGDTPMRVTLEPCYGIGGSFLCAGAEVTSVAPNNSFKPNPLRGSA